MKRIFYPLVFVLSLILSLYAQSPFSTGDLLAVKRVGDPQLSPDGRTVAFTSGSVDKQANRVITQIYTINIDGSNLKQITTGDKSHSSPRWSPDGKRLAFVTGGQIWTMEPDGDDREQITKVSTGAGGPVPIRRRHRAAGPSAPEPAHGPQRAPRRSRWA